MGHSVLTHSPPKGHLAFNLDNYKLSSYRHLCAGFFVDFFSCFWVNPKEYDCWIVWQEYV
jgi:hypothetical protein